MTVIEDIRATSSRAMPRIVLAEGEDSRVVQAALQAAGEGVAKISVVAELETFLRLAGDAEGKDLINVHEPSAPDRLEAHAEAYYQLRRQKGATRGTALVAMRDPIAFAAMLVRKGDADGMIGGAVATTSHMVRTALQIIGRAPEAEIVSSFFLMLLQRPHDRPVVFADCGLVIMPTAEELASIALSSAASFEALTSETPRVAMLSFSTHGSAAHESIDRVNQAMALVRRTAPDLTIEGELQFDAAIDAKVRRAKAPGSTLVDPANVFIFPDLNSGNIGYKIAERIGGATALGPILQGLAKPANDLSRGCSVDDIRQMIAVTGAQAAARMGAD